MYLADSHEGGPVKIYLIGSLRNPKIPAIAKEFRDAGFEVFDDWFACGPEADDKWQEYENRRGRNYSEALNGFAASHVFEFDKTHLDAADIAVLVCPAGRSGHLELGYHLGRLKPGFILLEQSSERWDVMYRFATGLGYTVKSIVAQIQKVTPKKGCSCSSCVDDRNSRRRDNGYSILELS